MAARVMDAHDIAQYLKAQRWFGDKSAAIAEARVENHIPVRWPAVRTEYAVLRVHVATDGRESFYQLFVRDDGTLDDALREPAFRRGLADAFARGQTFEGDGARWIIESETPSALIVPPGAPVALASGEQTNSSIVVDQEAILKLYRRLECGVHPDVEVTRFLTIERSFVHTPALLGTIRFEDAAGTTVAGMLQELVPKAIDGWKYALGVAADYFRGAAPTREPLPFEEEAQELGRVTRALHETLASGDPGSAFERRDATADDTRTWADNARRMAERALGSLSRALDDGDLPSGIRDDAKRVLESRAQLARWLTDLGAGLATDAGAVIRTHGDYHLGQVLRSATDKFLVIDFEGEPARPLEERRAHQSPLRDVAGMLRSFAYAAAVGGGADSEGADRARRWARTIRDAFLRGYFSAAARGPALLPTQQSNTDRLLALFETEKTFYELQYELDHRPDWVWIPLRGIAGLS